jgi:hypothetical protein
MSNAIPSTLGSDGLVSIPQSIWRQAGIHGGAGIVVEARDQEIVIRAAAPSVEEYTIERKAEFLLSNAVNDADYQDARQEVLKLGLDPDQILHIRPQP